MLQRGAWQSGAVQEERVGVEHVVAEKLKRIAMPFIRSRSQNGIDHASAIASLTGIVQARLDLEFLDDVRAGKRRIRQFPDVVVCGADPLDEIVVVVAALAVDVDAHRAPSELFRIIERAGGAA